MKRNFVCDHCKYFLSCGDETRTEPCKGYFFYNKEKEEDKQKTVNFYKDLVGSCKGTMYKYEIFTEEMAELMGISVEEAEEWERKIIKYGISERQNGGIVTNA